MSGPTLQWGGRFSHPPDPALLAFGSSLEDDLILAPFDVECSRAHVAALHGGQILNAEAAAGLEAALTVVAAEVDDGSFAAFARDSGAEDVHGAIDARVRLLRPELGGWLHAGRSRNDQVATTLALYVRDRASAGRELACAIGNSALASAERALEAGTMLAATTHWQPAQPVLLAFWLEAVAEQFVRAASRFAQVQDAATEASPLGSGACSGSGLPLDRPAAARALGFRTTTRNALDAAGDRDLALDLIQACTRAVIAAARVASELIVWCTPPFDYVRLDERATTGSSLMPQKRNPDVFELVRAAAAAAVGELSGALASVTGLPLSYHRDLQTTKTIALRATENALATLRAFERAFELLHWNAASLSSRAGEAYTVATDVADALILRGVSARRAHALVGGAVAAADAARRPLVVADLRSLASATGLERLEAPLDARASIIAKQTAGSTSPDAVRAAIDAARQALDALATEPRNS